VTALADTAFRYNEPENVRVPKLARLLEHLIAAEEVTLDDAIAAIAALTPAADTFIYFTSATAAALGTITAFGRSILDDANAAAVRTTIGAEPIIAAGTAGQYWRGDKSWQTLNAAAVANTPAGTIAATNVQAALNELDGEKEPNIAAGSAGQYWRFDKIWAALTAGAVAFTPAGSIAATDLQAAIVELDAEKQPLDAELTAIAGLASAANKVPYFTGSGAAALADFTAAGRALADDADAAAQRATLGLVIGTDVQAQDPQLAAMAGLTPAADQIIYWTGATTAAMASLTAFGRTLIDDADAATARATLGLAIGTNVQAFDTELAALAGLTSAADKLPYFSGAGTAALADFTGAARSLLDDASASAMRATLGLVIGTDVQAQDSELAAIAGLTSAADRLAYFTGSGTAALATFTAAGRALVDDADAAAQRTTLGLVIGTDVQAQDAELAAIAGLTSAADRLPYFTGSGTAALATFTAAGRALVDDADAAAQRTTLGLAIGTNVQAWDADLDAAASSGIAAAWTAYTPTVTAGTGAFTSVSAEGRYMVVGKTVVLQIVVTITTNGTAATWIDATLPFATANVALNHRQTFTGVEDGVTGFGIAAYALNNSTILRFRKYDATYPGADGNRIAIGGVYEAA
jgi:hypothetical protein